MTEQLNLEVAQDHLESISKVRKPIIAIEELVWNAFDADATKVDVELHFGALSALERIRVLDNGQGTNQFIS